ncbi:MAG: 16S rRNA (cytosine(967)-C(5))-methyltransferase RsmB [Bryobacterales bacterium]
MAVSPARRAAFAILLQVEQAGSFVDELLHGGRLETLEERDRALAAEIVLGVLRRRGALDARIEQIARRAAAKLDAEVRIALRMGLYQQIYLERIPSHAAVSESVELVKRGPKRSAAGLVNAVLRKGGSAPDETDEAGLNHPAWLVERWKRNLGEDAAQALMLANLERPDTWLRLNVRHDTEETLASLRTEGVESEPSEFLWARRLTSGRPEHTRAWREGRVRIQDIGSQAIAPLLGLEPGMRLLDLCAAPGGKTQHAVELLGGYDGVVACDLHPARLRRMRELGFQGNMVALDAVRGFALRSRFDRVLLDAPCSGTGTLGRNPDLKWRLTPEDIPRLAALQHRLLSRALDLVEPGGALVYSTCSLEPEGERRGHRRGIARAAAMARRRQARAYTRPQPRRRLSRVSPGQRPRPDQRVTMTG